jgi:hypothetical protein
VVVRLQNTLFAGIQDGIVNAGPDALRISGEHVTVSDCAGRFVVTQVGGAPSQRGLNCIFRMSPQ